MKKAISKDFTVIDAMEEYPGAIGLQRFNREVVPGEGETSYKITTKLSTAADKAVNYISGGTYKNIDALKFSKSEQLSYYILTIKEWFYDGATDYEKYWVCGKSDWNLYGDYDVEIKRSPDNKKSDCRINSSKIKRKDGDNYVYGFKSSGAFDASGKTKIKFLDVVKEINKLSNDVKTNEGKNSDQDGTESEKDPCYNAGIEGMSWVICPAVDNTSSTVGAMESTLKDWLQIKTEDTFKNQTYDAWNVFRTIANSILVIIFLAIIFSQLTGVGIDNYGIKKMLPRLIVMAILINLSYVICEIAVDLSNILGVGLTNLFKSIGQKINSNGADLTVQTIVANVLGLIGAGGVVAGVAASAASSGGVMIVISLLLALLVALVAVLMFFVMLGARMIIVIIFTILSPVAFALYILPNTQIVFKKWWKVFQAALVVFPICGALFGGSFIIKAIVISGNGKDIEFIPGLIAVVAPFLPFLLLPTLLKNALAGLGALGGTLSMLGNGLRKGARSGSEALQHGAKNSDNLRRLNNFTGRHSLSKKRRARAVADTAAFTKERAERDRLSNKANMRTRIASIAAAEEAKATDEATSQRLSLMMSSGSQGGIVMKDGTRAAYTLDNAEKRVLELRDKAAKQALSDNEKLELSALSRGMSSMAGGAGKLGKAIRGASYTDPTTGKTVANTNFMSAMGEIYSRDSSVKSKLNEKDVGASAFTEKFMPGGKGSEEGFSAYQGTPEYADAMAKRVKTYSAGLNQSGAAVSEYVSSLGKEDIQQIVDDSVLMSSLDNDARAEVNKRASDLGVKASQVVGQENQQRVADTVNEINDRLRADRQSSSSEPRRYYPDDWGDGADGYGE